MRTEILPSSPSVTGPDKSSRAQRLTKQRIENTVQGLMAKGLVINRVEVNKSGVIFHVGDGKSEESPYESWCKKSGQG